LLLRGDQKLPFSPHSRDRGDDRSPKEVRANPPQLSADGLDAVNLRQRRVTVRSIYQLNRPQHRLTDVRYALCWQPLPQQGSSAVSLLGVMLIAGTAVNAPQTLASRQLTPIHGLLADEHVALLSRQLWIFWAIVAAWGCTASIRHSTDVRFGSKADIRPKKRDVRFTPKSGHCC